MAIQIECMDAACFRPDTSLVYVDIHKLHNFYKKLSFRSNLILVGPKGIGKAQPLDASVLTPVGFVKMRDIHTGMSVIGRHGLPTKVLAVHPQGEKPIFRVRTEDGRQTECCGDHLWETRGSCVKSLHEIREVLTTARDNLEESSPDCLGLQIPKFGPVKKALTEPVSSNYHRIVEIKSIGAKECQCITVEAGDGLYVTDDYLVTHNSLSVASYAAAIDSSVITFDCSEDVRRSHLLGMFVLRGRETPFVLGPLTTAFEVANATGRCILVLEEINALSPQMQKVLNAPLDFRNRIEVPEAGRVFRLDSGAQLWIVGTMNTSVYSGVYELNEDLKSRVRFMPLGYPSLDDEMAILTTMLGQKAEKPLISRLLTLAKETRQQGVDYALSTRDVVQILEDVEYVGLEGALWLCSGKFEEEDRDTILERMESIFGVDMKGFSPGYPLRAV